MAINGVPGVFYSGNAMQNDAKGSFARAVLESTTAATTPFFALSAMMETEDTKAIVVNWLEMDQYTGLVSVTNNAAVGNTLIFADSSTVVPQQVYMNTVTGEYIYIDAIAGNTATVYRGAGTTVISAINGSVTPVVLQYITSAYEENSPKPDGFTLLGYPVYNRMHIIRDAWDVSRTAASIAYHTGDRLAKSKSDGLRNHKESIERFLMWSRGDVGTRNGAQIRLADGIVAQIEKRQKTPGAIRAQGASLKMSALNDWLQSVYSQAIKGMPNERIFMMDNQSWRVIGDLAVLNSQTRTVARDTVFGLTINRWETNWGPLPVMTSPIMNASPAWRGTIYALHPHALKVHYLDRTFNDDYSTSGTTAGRDGKFGVWTTEMTIENRGTRSCGIFTGINTAAAGL